MSYSRFTVISLQELRKEQALELINKINFRPDEPDVKRKFTDELNNRLFETHYSFASNPLERGRW